MSETKILRWKLPLACAVTGLMLAGGAWLATGIHKVREAANRSTDL